MAVPSVDRSGAAEALALWYTLAFRPVFAGEGDRIALIAAIAQRPAARITSSR